MGSGIRVLSEGAGWAVVDKPSGLAVHRSAEVRDRHTLMGAAYRRFGREVAPVHRLDRATSGCLLLSLDLEATGALHQALVAGQKRYVALVRGEVEPLEPIVYDQPLSDGRGGTKPAATVFSPVATCPEPRCSLVLAVPLTGRTHQIRRHLRDLSHPVLGDTRHGDTRVNRVWREELGLERLALHCLSIDAEGPTGRISATSPLPDDLVGVCRQLPWWTAALASLPDLVDGSATREDAA
jgi:tRNA pseudouridine65 synthase